MEIESSEELDCAPAASAYNRSHPSITSRQFECYFTIDDYLKARKSLNDNEKAGIGAGVGLVVISVILCIVQRRKVRRERAARAKDTATEVEMENRHRDGDDDHPPDYNSVAGTEVGSEHSEATVVQALEREETLPQYAPRGTN